MKKTTLMLLCTVLILSIITQAQHRKPYRNTIEISTGWHQLKFPDQHASPLVYKATAFPDEGLHFTHQGSRNYFRVKLSGGMGTASPERFGLRDYFTWWSDKDSFGFHVSSQFIHANLEATYLKS